MEKKHYHFIGIGGIGMSALARILLRKGARVSGSDIQESSTTIQLQKEGAEVFIGHTAKNIKKPHTVVFSSAVSDTNLELNHAKEKSIPVVHRSELLAQLFEGYAPLLVAGTHGKTTTVSLLVHVLTEARLDPSYSIGGYLYGEQNAHLGKGLYFAAEVDESDGTLTNYPSFGAIITNLEHDHMEFWKTEERLKEAFSIFASQVGSNKHLFWCFDDHRLRSLGLKGYSYGFDEDADLVVDNFRQVGWKVTFDLTFRGKHYREIELALIGSHNVLNAAAVFGLCVQLDVSEKILRRGLRGFNGIGRRMEKKGTVRGVTVYDDYAHHPNEIFSTLRAMQVATKGKRLIAVFQPHRFSRTKYCMDDFADAFAHADEVILTDIYAAGEPVLRGVTIEKVLQRTRVGGYSKITYVPREQLCSYLSKKLEFGDTVLTMGAGDITDLGSKLLKELNER